MPSTTSFMGLSHSTKRESGAGSRSFRRATPGYVVSYTPGKAPRGAQHESATLTQIAERLARLRHSEFAGEYDARLRYDRPVYFVPSSTLVREPAAETLGIRGEDDLFGGVVPHAFVATKTITHPLVDNPSVIPEGWSHAFAHAVEESVLGGYAAFSLADARRAGERLLQDGPVRLKPALEVGGRGQCVVKDVDELDAALQDIDALEIANYGLALEANLTDVETYSVGQVRVGTLLASYFGTQKLTPDEAGNEVYGGSDLLVARGDFDALLALDLGDEVARIVTRARTYDRAAREHYTGFFASRCNYDVVRGRGSDGALRCGVLEQSWRIGGASSAEIAALEAFAADATRQVVHVCCTEVYGEDACPPANAVVYYSGMDDRVGFITKYTTVERDGDA
jgi:hypothetical protein